MLPPLHSDDLERPGKPLHSDLSLLRYLETGRHRLAAGEDLIGPRQRSNARCLVHALAAVPSCRAAGISGMQADAQARRETVVAPMVGQVALDRDGAVDGRLRIGKGHEESVAGMVDLFPAVTLEARPQR